MTRWTVRGLGPRFLFAVLVLAGAALAGCGRKQAAPSEPAAEKPAGPAPAHVRNFVALAEAGYYNGLAFEKARTEELRDEDGKALGTLRTVEGGSPCYKTDPVSSSIGYWLRPEFSPPEVARHTAGTVGA